MQRNTIKLKIVYVSTVAVLFSAAAFATDKAAKTQQSCSTILPIPAGIKELKKAELQSIQGKLKSYERLHLEFKQGIYSTLRNKLRYISGDAYFAKPDKVRWNKSAPREEYTFNGKDLYVYNPVQKSAIKFSSQGSQAAEFRQLLSIVLSFDELVKKYGDANLKGWEDVGTKTVYLRASPDTALKEFVVKGGRDEHVVQSVCLQYDDGKFNSYEFTKAADQKFDEKVFTFVKPEGVKLEVYD